MQSSIGQNFRLFSAILAKVTCPSNATTPSSPTGFILPLLQQVLWVLQERSSVKDTKHVANAASVGGVFIPAVMESLGLWTPFEARIISQIASWTIIHNSLTSKQAQKNLFQQLSVKLWSYNAKMILHFMATTSRSSICDSPND